MLRPADARYGHVVVDEAQDLSPMQWRAIARRCPTQSFTLAGDEAQAVRAGAAATWDRILEALGVDGGFGGPPRAHGQLPHPGRGHGAGGAGCSSSSHRTCTRPAPPGPPGSVPAASTPGAGRSGRRTSPTPLPMSSAMSGPGSSRSSRPSGWSPTVTEALEHLNAVDAKGLEFDGVVVVDPEAIVRESPGTTGMARLYVALTRATTRLTILAPAPPGPPLDDALGPFEPVPTR